MSIPKKRFTKTELTQFFLLTSFTIHLVGILNTLYLIPSWILYMSSGEILASVAYTLCFLLIDSIFMFLTLLGIGLIWPQKWIKSRAIFISIQFFLVFIVGTLIFRTFVTLVHPLGLIVAISLTILFFFTYRKFRMIKIGNFLLSLADRVSILTFIYIFFDFLGVLIVLVRNL